MPAETITMIDCATNYGIYKIPGSKGKEHIVTMNGSEGKADCTCDDFKYRGWKTGKCKHIEQVWNQACMFNPQWHDGKTNPALVPVDFGRESFVTGSTCVCGGPMVAVRRAV